MRYMLLVYSRETQMQSLPPEEKQQIRAAHWAVMNAAAEGGVFHGAEPLASTLTATTVRTRAGKAFVTDGPFAETKEQLAGYYILDCASREEAIAWAKQIPTACKGGEGCIEIRPLIPSPQPGTPEFLESGRRIGPPRAS
ncbi:MAG: YciI family protein [Acidobacteria bacterium]|nr:MAG: YciI family protein [Acidobacteriota bacterium]